MFAAPPVVPGLSHAHSSEFSWPLYELPDTWLVQPPAGFWSDIISCHSWPRVIVKPSRVPGEFTKPTPQFAPWSMLYGWFENAMSPYDEATAPPVRVLSPL